MSTRTLLRGGTVITAVRPGEVLTDTDILIGADGRSRPSDRDWMPRTPRSSTSTAASCTRLRRHPPPHVAVGRPQPRVGLVAHGVPRGPAHRSQQALPSRGHVHRQLPRRARGARLRHHDARRLVAQPRDPRARGRRGRRPQGHRDARRLRHGGGAEQWGSLPSANVPPRRRPSRARRALLLGGRPRHDGPRAARSAVRHPRGQRRRLSSSPPTWTFASRCTPATGTGASRARSARCTPTACCPTASPTCTAAPWATTS